MNTPALTASELVQALETAAVLTDRQQASLDKIRRRVHAAQHKLGWRNTHSAGATHPKRDQMAKSKKQEIADRIAREQAETRAVQPRLKREFYQRQAIKRQPSSGQLEHR